MRYSLIALTVLGLLTACGQPQQNNSAQNSQTTAEQTAQLETERLNQWFEEKYEEQLQQSPIQMTFLGRKDRNGDIDQGVKEQKSV